MMAKYIKADDLYERLEKRYDGWNSAIDVILSAPTVDAEEVRHARWIYKGHHEMMGHVFECSACERCMFANSTEHVTEKYPYCHCGAKIDEVEWLEENK